MHETSTRNAESGMKTTTPGPGTGGSTGPAAAGAPPYFAHEKAVVESRHVGRGTRVWAFAHILPDARVGEDCNICDHVFVENDVVVGDRVTVKCGVQLWDGVTLEDDVFVGPNATFTNDTFPRSRHRPDRFERTLVRRGASVGANATILPGLTIGEGAMVGAGAVVTADVPAGALVVGNPARVVRWVDAEPVAVASHIAADAPLPVLRARGARLLRFPVISEPRGELTFAETGAHLPFTPQRVFTVTGVPAGQRRGEHAHRRLEEVVICVRGSCTLLLDDGTVREEVVLDSPSVGLYLPPLLWRVHYQHSPDALVLALASTPYEPADYIRSYDEFLEALSRS